MLLLAISFFAFLRYNFVFLLKIYTHNFFLLIYPLGEQKPFLFNHFKGVYNNVYRQTNPTKGRLTNQ